MARWKAIPWLLATVVTHVAAYEVPFKQTEYNNQVCSGMWGNSKTYINGMIFLFLILNCHTSLVLVVTFDDASEGQVSMVIYEWRDNAMLGKVTSLDEAGLPVSTADNCLLPVVSHEDSFRKSNTYAPLTLFVGDSAILATWGSLSSTCRRVLQ